MESARKVVLMILIAHSPIANVLEANVGMTKDFIKNFCFAYTLGLLALLIYLYGEVSLNDPWYRQNKRLHEFLYL